MSFPKGLDNHILAEPPSCPNDCPYAEGCDSEATGICELNEIGGAERDPDREYDDEADDKAFNRC